MQRNGDDDVHQRHEFGAGAGYPSAEGICILRPIRVFEPQDYLPAGVFIKEGRASGIEYRSTLRTRRTNRTGTHRMRKEIAAERTHGRSEEREFQPAVNAQHARIVDNCAARETPLGKCRIKRQTLRRANNRNGPVDPWTVPSALHDPPFVVKTFQDYGRSGLFFGRGQP